MIKNLGANRILWVLTAVLSLIVSLAGVLKSDIYAKVISEKIMPGTIAQDLLTIFASLTLLVLAVLIKEKDFKKEIIVFGILGYLFYAYRIYVIERVYTVLYFIYLAIFSLSFYSLIYGVSSIKQDIIKKVKLPNRIRKISIGYSLFIALVFSALWVGVLVPLISEGEKIEFMYSVFILDLCFIMPAFVILAVMAVRNNGLALLLTPSMYILGFTLLLPVELGELLKPYYNAPIDFGGMVLYLSISLLFLLITTFYLPKIKLSGKTAVASASDKKRTH